MTFGPQHYVPVLKIKRGEKRALGLLSRQIWTRTTPLLEIVERTGRELGDHLRLAFNGLAEAVYPFDRCFIDCHEIAPDGPAAAAAVFERGASKGIRFTPVTGISRSADVTAAMQHRANGLALRLNRREFEAGGLEAAIRMFMDRHHLAPEDTDLIADLGAVDILVPAGVRAFAAAFLNEIPYHTRWRTFTISSCAFPSSMGGVDRHSYQPAERADWLAWREGLYGIRATLPRLPTFSDGAIQHPSGVEGFDPRTMQVSASVRYTLPESWLLIKGESTRVTPASLQFRTLATQLVYGHLRQHYEGADHCAGCAGMKQAADGASGLGSAEAWRRLGTIHHITMAVQGLANLSWP